MALKVIRGVIDQLGPVSPIVAEAGPTGNVWAFVRFNRATRRPVTLEQVVADAAIGAHVAVRQTGRFAFYAFENRFVLCGFASPDGIEIAKAESDPAAIAAEAIRTPAKRKIFLGVLLIPTIIGLFFAFDIIKAGRATLREHPAPKRPGDKRVVRALQGKLYWPF
jgi:hypothetical protein